MNAGEVKSSSVRGFVVVLAMAIFTMHTACSLNTPGRLHRGESGDSGPDVSVSADADQGPTQDADIDADGDHVPPPDTDVTVDADRETIDDADPDITSPCTSADERCNGNIRITCESGTLMSEDCSPDRHCDETDEGPVCVENVCDPGTARCSPNGAALFVCDARGAEETRIPCSRGCEDAECRPQTSCDADIFTTMSSGTVMVDLCGAGADQSHTDACPWHEQSEPGEDVLIRLEVNRERDIHIQATQVSSEEIIDPTLHLRSECEDIGTEIWCNEDTNGQDEDFTEHFEPGDYFLVIDRHERVGTSCGVLEVVITPL